MLPKGDAVEPEAAPPPKRPAPGLFAAGVLDAPPPNRLDVPVVDAPPNRLEPPLGVVVLGVVALDVPNIDGVDPPELLLTAPNNGLFAAPPLFCCPKLKDMPGGSCDVV